MMNCEQRRAFGFNLHVERYRVKKQRLINVSFDTEANSSHAYNENCCRGEEQVTNISEKRQSNLEESKIEVKNQRLALNLLPIEEKPSLIYEILRYAWPKSDVDVDNRIITQKRCEFSNEPISIKPITSVPGIGPIYGQRLADHGFIYARQLLGYLIILKDSSMFRKWLEYRFGIAGHRAAEITSALTESLRFTL